MVLYNAFCYDDAYKIKRKCVLIIEQGIIKRIIYDSDLDNISFPVDCTLIDCKGRLIVPGFVDTHLHFPGSFLYQNYGISFLTDTSFEDYITSIRNTRYKGYKVIRGYGWDKYMLDSIPDCKGYKIIKKELDDILGDRPAILYSNDYHSFICNQCLINLYRQYGRNVPERLMKPDFSRRNYRHK